MEGHEEGGWAGLQLLAWEKPTALFWAKTHFRKSSRQSANPEGASELQVPEVSASGPSKGAGRQSRHNTGKQLRRGCTEPGPAYRGGSEAREGEGAGEGENVWTSRSSLMQTQGAPGVKRHWRVAERGELRGCRRPPRRRPSYSRTRVTEPSSQNLSERPGAVVRTEILHCHGPRGPPWSRTRGERGLRAAGEVDRAAGAKA